MFCSKCGFILPDDSAFCSKCGNKINKDNALSLNGKKLTERKCLACDNINLVKIESNKYYCNSCGSTYVVDDDTIIESEVIDEEIIEAMRKETVLNNQGKYLEGLEILKAYENLNIHNCKYWIKLGRAYSSCGNFDEGKKCYDRALKINDKEPTLYCNMASNLIIDNDFEKAKELYEKAIDLIDSGMDCQYGDYTNILANYGLTLIKTGEKEKGLKLVQRAESRGYKNGNMLRKYAGLKKSLFGGWH